MGVLEVAHVRFMLPNGHVLLDDVSFRVGDGQKVALIGANGTGKTTLLRILSGDLAAQSGTVTVDGRLGVMRQFIGSISDDTTVREFLLALSPEPLRVAAAELDAAEIAMTERDDDATSMRYAHALASWGDVHGYDAEVLWDTCTVAAIGLPFEKAQHRLVRTLSGGEQKKLALEALLRSDADVLTLDEPDNYLDIPGKRWLEEVLRETRKTVLFVSHDREVLANTADRIVTLEGRHTWVHGGGFASYHDARKARLARLDELHRRWEEEHKRLIELVRTLQQQAKNSPDMASRYHAMQTRLRKFEEAGPPAERPEEQAVTMRLRGSRTGKRAVVIKSLGIDGLVEPFDAEIFYGERVALLGPNGSGKTHLLRLLAGESIAHSGEAVIGARVQQGYFNQTHADPWLAGKTLVDTLWHRGLDRGAAIGRLRRYELHGAADQTFATLSGGQQARFQILLLEIDGANLLLLDEPTDNLDLASAEALEEGLEGFDGTVLAVTHDRWFMRGFDRFLVVGDDGRVTESASPEPALV